MYAVGVNHDKSSARGWEWKGTGLADRVTKLDREAKRFQSDTLKVAALSPALPRVQLSVGF